MGLSARAHTPATPAAVLLVWLTLQVLPLAASAIQLPLSEQFPRPAERLALDQMLIVQVTAAAMLWPVLSGSVGATVIMIATSWPFLQLCGVFSAAPWPRVVAAGGYLAGWLALLGIWRHLLQSNKWQMVGAAATTGLALGGPLLWYLSAEFVANQEQVTWSRHALAGPLMGVLAVLHQQPTSILPWLPLGIALIASAAACVVLHYTRRSA